MITQLPIEISRSKANTALAPMTVFTVHSRRRSPAKRLDSIQSAARSNNQVPNRAACRGVDQYRLGAIAGGHRLCIAGNVQCPHRAVLALHGSLPDPVVRFPAMY